MFVGISVMKKSTIFIFCMVCNLFAVAQKPVLTVPSTQNGVSAFKISPNGTYLLTGDIRNNIKVFDLKTKKEVFTFKEHQDLIKAIAIAPDNRTVISGDRYGDLLFWDLNTGKLLKRDTISSAGSSINSIVISPDGRNFITGDDEGVINYWGLKKMKSLYWSRYNGYPISKIGFSNNSETYFACSPDSSKQDTLINLSVVSSTSGDINNQNYFKSSLLKSTSFSVNSKYFYTVNSSPNEIIKYESTTNEKIFRESLDIVPFDILTLDEENLVIAGVEKNYITFVYYNPVKKEIIKKIKTDIIFSEKFDNHIVMDYYPNNKDEITFIRYGADYPSEIYSLNLVTNKINILNPRKTVDHFDAMLINDELYFSGEKTLQKLNFSTNQITTLYSDTSNIQLAKSINGDIIISKLKQWAIFNTKENIIKKVTSTNSVNWWDSPIAVLSPNKDLIAIANSDQINIYKTDDYSLFKVIKTESNLDVVQVKWGTNYQLILCNKYGVGKPTIVIYDINNEQSIQKINLKSEVSTFTLINDHLIAVGNIGGTLSLYDYKIKSLIKKIRIKSTGIFSTLNYEPKINKIVLSIRDGEIFFFNPITLEKEKVFAGHTTGVSVAFSEAYDKLYSISNNDVKVWDVKTGKELSTVSIIGTSEWVVLGERNLFDATPEAMKELYYVVNDTLDKQIPWKIIEFDQLKHRYYQPGLLQIQMGYSKEQIRTVPELDDIELSPKLKGTIIENNKLRIELQNQRGGVGKVSVYINNAEIIADARPNKEADKNLLELRIDVDLNDYANRFNNTDSIKIKVVAWNGNNWLSSKPEIIDYFPLKSKGTTVTSNAPKKEAEKPRLFALVFGTSDYVGTQIDLRYSSKDAADFASALKLTSQKLFGINDVEVSLFSSDEVDKNKQPDKANLIRKMEDLAKRMKPSDILMVYLSGHGVNFGGADGDFYYLTKEAMGADATYLNDPAVRQTAAISSAELTGLLNKITARKKMLILDACASGKAAETMLASARDVPASQVRALDRMQDRTGFYILSGSASDAVSYESSVYGQGLLTYSLLKAMRGAALRIDGGEEYVDIQKLFQYAVDEVPKLAAGIGGIQKPLYRSPDNQQSFDIGKSDEVTKKAIILSEPKPVFVAVGLQDPVELFDKLSLSEKINAALRENTAKGKTADFVFTEAKDYPGAYRISGSYELKENQLTLKYVLIKDGQRQGNVETYAGEFKDANTFANLFVEQLKLSFTNSISKP